MFAGPTFTKVNESALLYILYYIILYYITLYTHCHYYHYYKRFLQFYFIIHSGHNYCLSTALSFSIHLWPYNSTIPVGEKSR